MNNLSKVASKFIAKLSNVELKPYRKKLDDNKIENLVEKALNDNKNKDIDISFNDQHYGWFIWDSKTESHIQQDMNDFKSNDKVKDVREFVAGLQKVKLEDYT